MTNEVRSKLEQAGVNVNTVLERFMNNDALLEKFLKKFTDDKNYKTLLEAVATHNEQAAFTSAHTLKGVSANLSLESLQRVVSEQTEYFRAGDWDKGAAMMPAVTEEYEKITAVINEVL